MTYLRQMIFRWRRERRDQSRTPRSPPGRAHDDLVLYRERRR
jgi:hypothetical protein